MAAGALKARNGHRDPFGGTQAGEVTVQTRMLVPADTLPLDRLTVELTGKRVGVDVRLTLVCFPRPLFSQGRP